MRVIRGIPIYFDVDQTLLMFGYDKHPDAVEVERNGVKLKVVPHKQHIDLIKTTKFRKHVVIVWSAGGAEWAEFAIKFLKLEKYVDYVASKPAWFTDDRPADFFMPESNRIYFPLEDFKEKKKK